MNRTTAAASLLDRFPTLRRLEHRRRHIPYISQNTATDCGAACLGMVLAYFGKHVPLDELRAIVGFGRDGADALAIVQAARHFGLRVQSVRIDVDALRCVEPGAILYWNFEHFVVFERVSRRGFHIVDPGVGHRLVSPSEFDRAFTGVALLVTPTDQFERGGAQCTGLARHVAVLRRYRALLAKVLGASAIIQVLSLSGAVLTAAIVDRVLPRGDGNLLGWLAAGAAALLGLQFLAESLRGVLSLYLRTHLDVELTASFVEHLFQLPYSFFQTRPAGDLVMRMNSNTVVRELLTSGAVSSLLDGALVNGYLVVLFAIDAKVGALVLFLALAQVCLFLAVRRRQRELMSESLEVEARKTNYEVEMLAGIETLKGLGVESLALDRWATLFTDAHNVALHRGRLDALFNGCNVAIRYGSNMAVLLFGAYLVLSGEISLGTALAVGVVASGVLGPLANLVQTGSQLGLLRSYMERIDDVMLAAPEPVASPGTRRRLAGKIDVDRVSFRYSSNGDLVVRDLSITVQPGSYVCVVGPSGSGKSTLAKLLLGLYPVTSGQILFDGVSLRALDVRALRQEIGIVPQDPRLFTVSIRDNIAMGRPGASLADVIEVAEAVGLHEEIKAMPMGYETLLVGGGESLSGGQRQRIALARALLRRPSILILDEATSFLDAESERVVQMAIRRLHCTRIAIAHRLSTVVDADQIYVLEAGALIEAGSHSELLLRRGRYARLFATQVDPRTLPPVEVSA